ncbi:MAG: hypothetical protein ACRDKB_10860 [Actinomycetota bacterium]
MLGTVVVANGSTWSDYEERLRANLPFNWFLNRRIIAEINDHIAEAAAHWVDEGLAQREAEQRAVRTNYL